MLFIEFSSRILSFPVRGRLSQGIVPGGSRKTLLHISRHKTVVVIGDLEQKNHKLRLQFEDFLSIMYRVICAILGHDLIDFQISRFV